MASTLSTAPPALVRGGEDSIIDPGASDAPEQDTSSEEGLLDEVDYDDYGILEYYEHGIPCGGDLSDSSSAVCSISDSSFPAEDHSAIVAFTLSTIEVSTPEVRFTTAAIVEPPNATAEDRFTTAAIVEPPPATPEDRSTIVGLKDSFDFSVEARFLIAALHSTSEDRSTAAAIESSNATAEVLFLTGTTSHEGGGYGYTTRGDGIGVTTAAMAGSTQDTTMDEHGIPCGGDVSDSSSAVCSVDCDTNKPSSLEATEVLDMPSIIHKLDRELACCDDQCDDVKKPSAEATEALVIPGITIYECDIGKTSIGGQLIRSTASNQLQSRLQHSSAQLHVKCNIRKSSSIRGTSNYYQALVNQLAASSTSHSIVTGPFDPGGVTPSHHLLPSLFDLMRQLLSSLLVFFRQFLPCLFNWHVLSCLYNWPPLGKPASRQRPLGIATATPPLSNARLTGVLLRKSLECEARAATMKRLFITLRLVIPTALRPRLLILVAVLNTPHLRWFRVLPLQLLLIQVDLPAYEAGYQHLCCLHYAAISSTPSLPVSTLPV